MRARRKCANGVCIPVNSTTARYEKLSQFEVFACNRNNAVSKKSYRYDDTCATECVSQTHSRMGWNRRPGCTRSAGLMLHLHPHTPPLMETQMENQDTRNAGLQPLSLEDADKIIQSIQKNPLIRGNLPPVPEARSTDAGLRP